MLRGFLLDPIPIYTLIGGLLYNECLTLIPNTFDSK